jgi:Ca-activated chloride channel family protein
VDRLSARGNTDINRALLEAAALVDESRPSYLIFLTDGLPTEGVTDSQQILENFHREAPDNLRLFAFGVGYDVDTYLLDSLAQENHGASFHAARQTWTTSAFYERSAPRTDLALIWAWRVRCTDPARPVPGGQIIAVGRYRSPGAGGHPEWIRHPDTPL